VPFKHGGKSQDALGAELVTPQPQAVGKARKRTMRAEAG
jgi:hypothetical protein